MIFVISKFRAKQIQNQIDRDAGGFDRVIAGFGDFPGVFAFGLIRMAN